MLGILLGFLFWYRNVYISLFIEYNCQSTDHSSHCCTDTHLDNMDFETIMKNKWGGKFSLAEGQKTEKEKVTSWLNKGGEGSREEVNRRGGSNTGGGRETSVGPGGREGKGNDSMTGITPKTRVNNATQISNKKKHDRLLEGPRDLVKYKSGEQLLEKLAIS